MGINYNSAATTEGLVFCVDAATPKSYVSKRENLLTYSTQIGDPVAGWDVYRPFDTSPAVSPRVDINAGIAPDGTNTATRIETFTSNGSLTAYSPANLLQKRIYTYSIYFKQVNLSTFDITIDESWNGGQRYRLQYNYSTQVVTTSAGPGGNSGDGIYISGTVTSINNGWFRAAITFQTNSPASGVGVQRLNEMIGRFNGPGQTLVWGRQLETGSVMNDFVPTTTTAISKPATWIDTINGNNVTLVNNPPNINNMIQFRENAGTTGNTISGTYGTAVVDYGILTNSGKNAQWSLETMFQYLPQTSGNGNWSVFENVIFGRSGCHGGIYTWDANIIYAAIKTQDCWGGHVSPLVGTAVANNHYHVVMTYNAGVTKTYLNGVFVATQTLDTRIYNIPYSNILHLGGINTYISNINMHFAKAYTKELTAAEVLQNFNASRGRGGI
jgi:hypothetical protein